MTLISSMRSSPKNSFGNQHRIGITINSNVTNSLYSVTIIITTSIIIVIIVVNSNVISIIILFVPFINLMLSSSPKSALSGEAASSIASRLSLILLLSLILFLNSNNLFSIYDILIYQTILHDYCIHCPHHVLTVKPSLELTTLDY